MSFKENLLRKIELEKLAARVIASIGTGPPPHHIDKESMRRILELSPYKYVHERDLDLYVREEEAVPEMVLILDNELPIFHSTIKDVVTRRSPRTLEMWKISTIRKILDDSDVKISTGAESVETVLQEAVAQLDLIYTEKDIRDLAREGMAWLAGRETGEVKKILVMFASLLGYREPPRYFGLDQAVSYGAVAAGPGDDVVFGPLILYRTADNVLAWIDRSISRSDKEQMEFLRAAAAGRASLSIKGDAVFEKLQENVLGQPEHVKANLASVLKNR